MKKLKSLVLGVSVLALVSACSSQDEGPRVYHDVLVTDSEQFEFQPIQSEDSAFEQYSRSASDGSIDVTNFSDEGAAPVHAEDHGATPTYSDGSIDVYLPWAAQEDERALVESMDSEPVAVVQPVVVDPYLSAREKSDRAAKVYFGHGAKVPDEKAERLLTSFSESIKDKDHPIEVTGYASTRADIDNTTERQIANLKTSLDRAFAVSSDLIRKGVPASTIKTSAWGESHPAETEDKSRRVEITSRLGE